jgi:hypothetical protein
MEAHISPQHRARSLSLHQIVSFSWNCGCSWLPIHGIQIKIGAVHADTSRRQARRPTHRPGDPPDGARDSLHSLHCAPHCLQAGLEAQRLFLRCRDGRCLQQHHCHSDLQDPPILRDQATLCLFWTNLTSFHCASLCSRGKHLACDSTSWCPSIVLSRSGHI